MTDTAPPDAAVPRATYRLQLHGGFRFADAAGLAPYLAALGISHVYLSPIFKARRGSLHGYDTVDHGEINPELGSLEQFRSMAAAFQGCGLGIILDIVPNHMGVGGADNFYWLDVLEHGEKSRYADWFDINWHSPAPGLCGRLLVPFLGESFAEALHDGALRLKSDGGIAVWAYDHHKLPLSPETAAGLDANDIERVNNDPAALAALLDGQHWRLAPAWVGDDEINYRRFFIVSDLAGIRIERPDVFTYVHRLPFQLIAEGFVDGLRIDHVDGLYDPRAYCRRLREAAPRPIYIVAEKILAPNETLPDDWNLDGTTGYEFASLVTPLLVDPLAEARLTRFHRDFSGIPASPRELEEQAKFEMVDGGLAGELEALSWRFARLALTGTATRDLTRRKLHQALRAIVAAMPVYRCYVAGGKASEADRRVMAAALTTAGQGDPPPDAGALAFVGGVLTGEVPGELAADVAMRTQQFTTAVMAKGLEDTALYRANRLIALNDVGERPEPFSISASAFHASHAARAAALPHSMLGTTTHDSKRGEDLRCRIAALSGCADVWVAGVPAWLETLRRGGAPVIDNDDAYYFFQLLLGAWTGTPSPAFVSRMIEAMRKSLREARLRTSWSRPDAAYEQRIENFVEIALAPGPGGAFLEAFADFEARIGLWGALNGLVETTLKLTVPGVPDFYQGAELWEQSMVDPDNRRPVDFDLRRQIAEHSAGRPLAELLTHWRDGAVKLGLIQRLLACRAAQPQLFAAGFYRRLETGDDSYAFIRQTGDAALLVAVQLYPWRGPRKLSCQLPGGLDGLDWTDGLEGAATTLDAWPPPASPLPIAIALGKLR